ncbi:MAG: lysophospholipid acyltransferase family protein [Paludibacter sp.]|nr:lysophospholipid acyltransferase family protein [Paludibacter sp.]
MKRKSNPVFVVYQWLIAFPVLLVLTIITAIATIILSPLFPNSNFAYWPARWWGRAFCYLLFIRVKVTGMEKLHPYKSYVIACNHQSMYDIFVVYGWLPMIFKWMMKVELRKIPLVGNACSAAGHVFIDRSNPIAAKHSLEIAEKQLSKGASVVIFPEGTRSFDGKMGKFKRGAFRIATDLNLPIVPVTLKGCYQVMSRYTFNVTPGTIEVIVHDPIDVNLYLPDKTNELIQMTWDEINNSL